jgi:hypothetical protein
MTDGKKYDGRFNLEIDQPTISDGFYNWWAGKNETMTVSGYGAEPEEIMADYFNISLEEYLAGQAWAKENLERVCSDVED